MDDAHDSATAQDPRGLPALPRHHPQPAAHRLTHVIVTGEPGARKPARRVREGDVGKGPKGTSPTSYLAIMDPTWGHLTIKMSGHPPFGAQVILNGHEYVACQAQTAGIGFTKEGNCFTRIDEPERLAEIADTLSRAETIGRLSQVIDRWIYTACLCFGLDRTEQARGGFGYSYSIYQVEYSRNLLFAVGGDMDRVFNAMADRTRSRLDVPKLRTLFGTKQRPRQRGADLSPRWRGRCLVPN